MGGQVRPSTTPSLPRARGESDTSYRNRLAAASRGQAIALQAEKDRVAAAEATYKQKLDALIAVKYPQGLPSWVAANGLKPQLTTEPNRMVFEKVTSDGRTYYGEQGEFRSHYSDKSQGPNPLTVMASLVLPIILPGVGAALGGQLMAAGIVTNAATATIVGTALAGTAVQVAQGVPIEQAIKNGIVSAGIGVYSPEETQALTQVLGNPTVAKAVVNAGASVVKTAAAGGNADQITAALTNSLVNSGTNAAIGTVLKDVDPQTGKVLGATISGAINNGAEGALKGAVSAVISEASKPNVSPTGDVRALPPDQVAALTGDQITDNLLLPLEETPPLPNNTDTEVIAGEEEPVLPTIGTEDLTSPAASDQAFQDALDRSTTSDIPVENKPIEDVLTDAGLVTDEELPFTVEVTGIANPLIPLEEAPPLPDNTVTEVDLTKDEPIENVLTDAGLSSGEDNPFTVEVTGIANPLLPLEEAPPLPDNTVTEVDLILKDLEEAPPLPDNTVTEVIAGEDNPLLPLEPAPPLPDNTVKEVIADTPGTPVTPKIPVAPKIPVTPKIPTKPVTPVTPTTPVKSTDPVEQLYQTTTQSQPTALADIQYYLDMTGTDIFPSKNKRDPVESLLNQSSQSMSIEELLRNLRS